MKIMRSARRLSSVSLGAVVLAATGCADADARTLAVSTDKELASAIASARSGDRITLAPGTYAPVNISNRTIEGEPVVVAGKGAVISHLGVFRSQGWHFDGLEIGGTLDPRGRVVRIENSKNVAVRNSLIRGQNMNGDPWDDTGFAFGLRFAEDISILSNRIRETYGAVMVGSSRNVSVAGNSIAYVREGINWVAVDGGEIRCNRISHIFPNYGLKEHPDAIQFWTNKDGGSNDILIEGNFINTGGPRAVHGMLIAGAAKADSEPRMWQRNLTVRDNIYYGSALHGISIYGAKNAIIERNTVLGSDHAAKNPLPKRSADGRESAALVPKIRLVGDGSSGRAEGNIATSFTLPPPIVAQNNLQVSFRGTSGPKWKQVFQTPPTGSDPPLEAFVVDPASQAGKAGQGARLVCGSLLPPAPQSAVSG